MDEPESIRGTQAAEAQEAYLRRNYAKALELYKPLAHLGSPKAMITLARIYDGGDPVAARDFQNFEAARYWYEKALTEANLTEAALGLGAMHFLGRGVPVDYEKSFSYYQKFESTTSAIGLLRLGVMYETGRGVRKDFNKARELYSRAAKLGNIYARKNLGLLLWKHWHRPWGLCLRIGAICQGTWFFIFKKNSPRIRAW